MVDILSIVAAFSGGAIVGGAMAAFITLLQVIPRLLHIIDKRESIKFLEDVFIAGSVLFSFIYFTDWNLMIAKIGLLLIGLLTGIFTGFFSSALAESLNVLPVIAKKFKIKKNFEVVILALLLGKTVGALYYFIIIMGGSNGKLK